MTQVTITRESTNVGFGWTNRVRQELNHWALEPVNGPDIVGTPAEIVAEAQRTIHDNSGNEWHAAFFVDGHRVTDYAYLFERERRAEILSQLRLLYDADYADGVCEDHIEFTVED